MKKTTLTRRSFIARSALASSAIAFPFVSVRNVLGANDRLNIAGIGVGGKGSTDVSRCGSQNIVALVDVDDVRAKEMYEKFPKANRFMDYRIMFEEMSDKIDAVTVSTPDHMHFLPAMRAIKEKKHVFCQKPLTHTVWEARELAKAAKSAKVATQMGNQGVSSPALRRDAEIVKGGGLGTIKEMHCWTDRPGDWWKQGVQRPTGKIDVPDTLDWDLWLGCAPERPYNPAYVPFAWRGYWDFGTGAIGDMGCHLLNLATLAMDIRDPEKIVAEGIGQTSDTGPTSSHIVWDFPDRKGQPAFKFHWYDGGQLPPQDLYPNAEYKDNGILMVGSDDTLLTNYNGGGRFKSGRRYDNFKDVPQLFPKCEEWDQCHYDEWFAACKGGPAALSNFSVSGPVTEVVLLGQVALRAGTPIEWNAERLRVTNNRDADKFLRTEYRKGWDV
jgi:predicted dehydrogenase